MYVPNKLLLFLLGSVQFVDVGERAAIIMHPEHGAAVVTSGNQTVLSQEEAGEVGQV